MKISANDRLRLLAGVALLALTPAVHAEWRTYSGGFSSRWKTVGVHGHDQPLCAEQRWTYFTHGILVESPNCNPVDFARGNLDNSIGFRTGRERDFLSRGPLRLVAGVEGSLSYTEYNLTQADFFLISGAITAGADLDFGGVRIGGRYGAGPFGTSDGQELGISGFREAALTLPLRRGAALRVSWRNTESLQRRTSVTIYGAGAGNSPPIQEYPGSPAAREVGLMFVASPEYGGGTSRWEFSSATGNTASGQGIGGDRGLRDTIFTRFCVSRDLPWHDLQLDVSWTSTAHESERPSMFYGYNGNYRSKTIEAYGVSVARTTPLFNRLSIRYGGGVEVADWRDEHQLLTRDGKELMAGVETAMTGSGALRYNLAPHVAIEAGLQTLYWRNIDFGESRWSLGIVLTR